MFNRKTCLVAGDMANGLQARHTKLFPQSREMGVLIEQVIYPIEKSGVNWTQDNLDDLIKTMSLHDMTDENSVSDQQHAIEEYTSQLSSAIKTNLNITRRLAIPLIDNIFDTVQHRLNDLKESAFEKQMVDIRECGDFTLIDSPMFTDMVMKYSDSNFTDAINTARIMQPMKNDALLELVLTGSDSFNQLIQENLVGVSHPGGVVADNGPTQLERVWNEHFVNPEAVDSMYTSRTVSNGSDVFGDWSIAFLLASALLNADIPDGVTVSLEEFNRIMNNYRAFCGYQVQRLVKNYQAKRDTGLLVIDEYTREDGTNVIIVVPELMKKARESGVTPEVIAGYKLNGGSSWFIDTLVENKDTSKAAFERSIGESAVGLQLSGRKVLRDTCLELISNFSKESKTIDDAGTTVKATPSVESINNQMREVSREIEDVFDGPSVLKYIQETVTKGLFEGTMVSIIVERMNVFMEAKDWGPVVDVRNAGLMAAMSICVDSLLSQFGVELSLDK